MTKQEEIQEWINKYLTKQFIGSGLPEDECRNEAKKILSYLHSQGIRLPDSSNLIEVKDEEGLQANPDDSPKPGSDEAIAQGCACAVLDNCHGKGIGYGRLVGLKRREMSEQEEIKEWLIMALSDWKDDICHMVSNVDDSVATSPSVVATVILLELMKKGVVMTVERELPPNLWRHTYQEGQMSMLKAGYVAVMPLIEEEK